MPIGTIGTSISSKWVGHWLDKVGHYQTHLEGSIWTIKVPKKWHQRPQRRQKWPFLEVLGPWCHFMGAQKAKTDILNVFDNFQSYLTNGQPIWSRWGCLWPKMAFVGKIWPFLGSVGPPGATFWGPLGPKQVTLDVLDNVQPCSTNVQPIWSRWRCLWPKMAIIGRIWPFLGPLGSPGAIF